MIRPNRKGLAAALLAGSVMIAGTAFAVLNAGQASAGQPRATQPIATVIATVAPTVAPFYQLHCGAPGTNAMGFNPPLTLVNQYTIIDRTTAYRSCNAPAFPNIRSGYEYRRFGFPDDCLVMLQASGTSNFSITWNTSQTSHFAGTRNASLSGNTLTVVFTGSITSGLFAGRRARQIFKSDATELVACLNGTGQVPFRIADVTFTIY